jgi:hypothetical protein
VPALKTPKIIGNNKQAFRIALSDSDYFSFVPGESVE